MGARESTGPEKVTPQPFLCWFSDHQRLFDFHRWGHFGGRIFRCRRCGVDY